MSGLRPLRIRHAAWALPVAGAVTLAPLIERPLRGAAVIGAAAALAGVIAAARRLGLAGAWLAALAGSIMAGEMAAIGFGGQSGRLLWADAVLALGLAVAIARGRAIEIPRASFLAWLAPLLAWCAVGLLWAPDPLTGIAELKEWVVAALAGAAALVWARDASRARRLLMMVALTGLVVAAAMVGVALRNPLGLIAAVMLKRVDLPWGRSNYLAGLLILAFPIALGLLGSARRAWARAAWGACLAILALGLVVSASKGAIAALLLAFVAAFLPARGIGRGSRAFVLGVIVACAVLVLATPLHRVLSYRLAESALDYSSGERVALYRLAWNCFVRHPWGGIGLNNFSVAANALHGVDTVPHNLELGFLAELGLPGFALAALWIGALGRSCWRCRRAAGEPRARALAIGIWGSWLAFVLHNQIESTLYGEQLKLLLFLTAAAAWRLGEGSSDSGARRSMS
ncbi:MAG: O-antigen ligase family protein [Candidatus Eisenbacteria bacterium]|uniref:O-antigen ligase family protein n=1 Tax=Eiseniibacteriota bacterium TaxID=2212470 RepID=A0A538U800_UNCEI|nr:MAG: O-antigen ligase family protein [Candidatus Eisenbacteria bacterium]